MWESADLLLAGFKLTKEQYFMPVLGLLFLRWTYYCSADQAKWFSGGEYHHSHRFLIFPEVRYERAQPNYLHAGENCQNGN